jgi:Flp pilus assembly protein TadD
VRQKAVLLVLALAYDVSAQTYSKDVAPIVYEFCAPCHRPGEAAPFSLLEYGDVRDHAKQIAAVTASRFMPPWKPAPGRGNFAGERRLTEEQIRVLAAWAERGSPEGDPKDLGTPPKFVEGWQLGTPDLVVTLDGAYQLAASGSDVFRNFVLHGPVDRPRYVRAVEIRPGTKTVVHHANLLVDRGRTLRRRDGKDGSPGFPGMDVQVEGRTFDPDSHFLFWKPGTTVVQEPDEMAWLIDAETDLILNMHLQPSGKAETIRPSIGLYFTDKPPVKRPMLVQMEHDGAIDIKAGSADFSVADTFIVPVAVEVLAIYPHAHYVARDMQVFANLPDGSRTWLIHIPDWDLNWQAVYRYKRPLFLPKGSVITMRYTYDNSTRNPRNPSHPPMRVVAGDRAIDEMAHFWLQVLPRPVLSSEGDPRRIIQQAVMRRRLEKYPLDFQAHFTLGSMSQDEGDLAAATEHYRAAIRGNPRNSTAHNSLGSALLAAGNEQAAAAAFRSAIDLDSDYADAHYNLARILLAKGQTPLAIHHLRQVIRIDPKDAPALSDLGAALYMTGEKEQGLALLREAVQQQPGYFSGRYNLAQALAAAGKTSEAEAELREALRLKPEDPDALETLKQMGRK